MLRCPYLECTGGKFRTRPVALAALLLLLAVAAAEGADPERNPEERPRMKVIIDADPATGEPFKDIDDGLTLPGRGNDACGRTGDKPRHGYSQLARDGPAAEEGHIHGR